MIREHSNAGRSGLVMLVLGVLLAAAAAVLLVYALSQPWVVGIITGGVLVLLASLAFVGLFAVSPREAKVLQLFGAYQGTCHQSGLRWANPFYSKTKVSVRVRNFETGKMKVNDLSGNPIEIGAVVVWRVVDTAEALFNVDDFANFVSVQSEAALRSLATRYPYDAHEDGEKSLVGQTAEISDQLRSEVQERLDQAGIEIQETRISHLAYAPEIAAAMLQRQQASAVVAARAKIVEGAVGMVEHALEMLSQKRVVELDEERRAAMVSNLLVVLCSDRHTQPVVNTGSLYH